jgi:Protein of unknown function (DUF3551)
MKHILAAAVLAAGAMGVVSSASAYVVRGPDAPWCAIMNMGTGVVHEDCSYASLEACRPNILAGNRGFCNPNPAYRGAVVIEHRRHAQRHWRRHLRRY